MILSGSFCCFEKNNRILIPSFIIYISTFLIIIFSWFPHLYAFHFSIINIMSLVFIFKLSKQNGFFEKSTFSLKPFLFAFILTTLLFFSFILMKEGEPIENMLKIKNDQNMIDFNFFIDYLIILLFLGFLIIHFSLNNTRKKLH